MDHHTQALRAFLDQAHSVYHAQQGLVQQLKAAGFQPLQEQETWQIAPGGRYYVTRGDAAVMAFRVPQGVPTGFMMSASHLDRPCFKVKENGELTGTYTRLAVERYGGMILSTWLDRPLSIAGRVAVLDRPCFKVKENGELTGTYTRLAVERYGGMILSTWLDRPLSIAGRVAVQTEQGIRTQLVDIDQDLLLIPNVAIHMNRQVNDGYKWNPAVDLLPLLGGKEATGRLETMLEEQAGGKILGRDLYLYIRQKSSVWGVNQEYLSSAALDDLECAWACTQGFLEAADSQAISVLCLFDSEEVGSGSVQGAGSTLLADTLHRICQAGGWDLRQLLAQSFLVSADNAHALHPNHPEFSDAANAPVMGGGVVIKHNASMSYCTDGVAAGLFRSICQRAEAATQSYYNRADLPGGSTLGHISLAHVSVPTVDIGLAQLAMHSSFEAEAATQSYYNRADLPGGSTLGHISLAHVSVPTVDIGLAQLAMHSSFETGAISDIEALVKAMTALYSTALEVRGQEYILR